MLLTLVLAAASLAATYHVPPGDEILLVMVAILCVRFYLMQTRLLVGMSQAELSNQLEVPKAAIIYVTQVIAVTLVYIGPYSSFALICLPWIVISGIALIAAILYTLNIIGFREK